MTPSAVKICGLTRAADLDLAVALGATHVGLVIAADSPRAVTTWQARALAARARGRAVPVLVVRGLTAEQAIAAARAAGIGTVQAHDLPAASLDRMRAHGLACIEVHAVRGDAAELPTPSGPGLHLFDVGRGGSGQRFSWRLLAGRAPARTFVAGGITPANVGELMAHRPWGIDCSSGVEAAPGRKDPDLLRALFAALPARAHPCPPPLP